MYAICRFVILLVGAGLFFWLGLGPVSAAAMYLTPSGGSYTVGNVFSTTVFTSSEDQAMNGVSGVVVFPADKLEVTSVSSAGSIVNFWVIEPNSGGNAVSFEGVVFNPGYQGPGGKIATINFRAKSAGTATVSYSSGTILANDGHGTNITSGVFSASYNLQDAVFLPNAPQVTSSTHPDPDQWYSNNNPQFRWNLPADVDSVRILFDENAGSTPTFVHSPPITAQDLQGVGDGVWYFHVQFHNTDGWGPVTHFRVQIDTTKPERFEIKEIERSDPTLPKVSFEFIATENYSEIDHFEVQIDGQDWITWLPDDTNIYTTDVVSPGQHQITAKAVDKAGNFLESSATFFVAALDAPEFLDYDRILQNKKFFVLKGLTYLSSHVNIWLQKDADEAKLFTVNSDGDGKFTFVTEGRLESGRYRLWAQVSDPRGAMSGMSENIEFIVQNQPFFIITIYETTILLVWIGIALAVVILLAILVWSVYKLVKRYRESREKSRRKRS